MPPPPHARTPPPRSPVILSGGRLGRKQGVMGMSHPCGGRRMGMLRCGYRGAGLHPMGVMGGGRGDPQVEQGLLCDDSHLSRVFLEFLQKNPGFQVSSRS